MLCAGDSSEFCGAGGRLTVYAVSGTAPPTTSAGSTPTPTSTVPIGTGFPTGWTSQGCWAEPANGRMLTHQQPDSTTNTLQQCVQTCAGLGYTIAGAEYGVQVRICRCCHAVIANLRQCFCDNFVYNGGALAANQADCNVPCPGLTSTNCGAGNRISMMSIGTPQVFQAPGPQISGLPTGWKYSGCVGDNVAAAEAAVTIQTFPYKIWDKQSNTPAECITQCQTFGFNAAGLVSAETQHPIIWKIHTDCSIGIWIPML